MVQRTLRCKAQVLLFLEWPLWKIEGEWLVAQCMIMQHRNVLENLFTPPPHKTCTDICGTIRPAYLCQLNVHFLPFHIQLHKGLRNMSLVLWDFLLIIEFMHACVCTMNGERMVGHPEHPVSLSRMEYTHHYGMKTLFIGYNGRLSYSHVIWHKKDNLSFCSSIPLKAVRDKIWFMWNLWDTRCAFGDKQEQVIPLRVFVNLFVFWIPECLGWPLH